MTRVEYSPAARRLRLTGHAGAGERGSDPVCAALSILVYALLDAGASENTLKRVEDACASHQVPLYRISPGALGHAIGKPGRMVISVPAGRMADKLLTYFQEH